LRTCIKQERVVDMARKRIKVSRRMLLVWLVLSGSIILLTPQNITNKFQFAFARIFHWPLSVGKTISLSARPQNRQLNSNQKYENHIDNLKKQLQEVHAKIDQLSGLRERGVWRDVNFMLADVTSSSLVGTNGKLVINRGQIDGLTEGQYVLGDNSIIGTVFNVTARASQVRLISDPDSKMAVEVGRLNVAKLMQGKGNNTAKILSVTEKHRVKVGDIVYARKKAGFLNATMIVGKVSACKTDDNEPLLLDVTVKPVCNFEKLGNVAVIVLAEQ